MKKFILVFIAFFVLFSLFTGPLNTNGAEPKWEKPLGVYGGEIDKVIASTNFSSDKTIFAGGIQGFYVSFDGANTFNSVKLDVGYNTIFEGVNDFTLSNDFSSNKELYIATKNGIYVTNDFGKTFKAFQLGIDATYITQITTDPKTGTLLAVGLSYEKRQDDKVVNTNLLMKYTKSNGRWVTISKFTSDYITAIFSYNDNYFVGTEYGEVFKIGANDKKLIFSAKSPITDISVNENVIGISTLYNGVYLSKDFENFVNDLPSEQIVGIVAIDFDNLYALARNKNLYIKEKGEYRPFKMPFNSTNISFDVTQNSIFIASYEYGVIKFDRQSNEFTIANQGITNVNTTCLSFSPNYSSNKTVYLGTSLNGLYVSYDGGKSFSNTGNLDNYQILDVKELSNGNIVVGTIGSGLLVSKDKGKTFSNVDILKNNSVSVIYEYNGQLFIGTKDAGLFVTDLNFSKLSKIKDIYPYDVSINFVKGSGNYLFVATNGGNLYRSLDYGKTFKEIANNAFWGMSITGFDISPNFINDGFIFVGTASGEYASFDKGNSFTKALDLGLWADGVAISPNYTSDGCLLVGAWGPSSTTYGSIFISHNRGISFNDIGYGMTNRYVVNVYLSPDFYYGNTGSIFAITSSGGVFRYTFKTEIVLQIGSKDVYVNGQLKTIDVAPYIKNSRTLVPIRFISESFGADVSWDSSKREVKIVYANKTIILTIGKPTATVNGVSVPIDKDNPKVVPEITNNRTFVPLRFISETFGANVEWDNATRKITITLGG